MDKTRAMIEKILGELMSARIYIDPDDPRAFAVHHDICKEGNRETPSEDEIRKCVIKHYRFKAVVYGYDHVKSTLHQEKQP